MGAQEVMGLRDSSKFNTAHQAGVRDPDRPSPTSITSFFDYHVISFIQALHERHLARHRPCPAETGTGRKRPRATVVQDESEQDESESETDDGDEVGAGL